MLTRDDLAKPAVIAAAAAGAGLAVGVLIGRYAVPLPRVNVNRLHPEMDKAVDTVAIEDIGEKVAFCRCWRSKKFPYCDGSHSKHNQCTGDNVGPIIVKK